MKRASLVLVGLCGCGGGGGDEGGLFGTGPDGGMQGTDAPTPIGVDPRLDGAWSAGCFEASDLEMEFSGTNVVERHIVSRSTDPSCVTPVATITYNQRYRAGGPAPFTDNAAKIDFEVSGALLVLHAADLVTAYNESWICGINTWSVNVAQEVTGRTCVIGDSTINFESQGTEFFTIYRVENARFYLGDNSSGTGTSDGTRPTRLQTGYFQKTSN